MLKITMNVIKDFVNNYLPFEDINLTEIENKLQDTPIETYQYFENMELLIDDNSEEFESDFDNLLDSIYEYVLCFED